MHGRAMRVAMQQNVDTVIPDRLQDRLTIYVGDFLVHRAVASHALLAGLHGEGDALFDGLRQHHGLPFGVASHRPDLLVLDIVGTQCITMTEQHFRAVQFDRMRVLEQGHTSLGGKSVPNHEVAIAVHEKDGNPAISQFANC